MKSVTICFLFTCVVCSATAQFLTGFPVHRPVGSGLATTPGNLYASNMGDGEHTAQFIFRKNQLEMFFDSTLTEHYPLRFNTMTDHPDHVPFQFAISSTDQFPYGGKNNVMMWGWNIGAGGGNFVPGRPGIGFSLESNYHPEKDSVTTWVESHEFYLTPQGKQIRLKSCTIDTKPDGMIDLYHTADNLYLRSKKNTNVAPVSMAISGDSLGQFNFMGIGTNGTYTSYSIGTTPGMVNFGSNNGRTSDLNIGNFNRILFGQPGEALYNGLLGQFENFTVAAGININRGVSLVPAINFNYSTSSPDNFSLYADYTTGAMGMSTSGNSNYFLEFSAGGSKSVRIEGRSVKIGDASTPAAPGAALEISSSKGLLLPRLTTAERDALGSTIDFGMLIYNKSSGTFQGFTPSGWVDLTR